MSVDSAQRDVVGHQRQIARLQEEKGREANRAGDSFKKAAAAAAAVSRAGSASTAQSKMREAQRYQDEAVKHQNKVADYETKIAVEQKRLIDAQKKLNSEMERVTKRQVDEQKKATREYERQMRAIDGKLASQARFQRRMENVVDKLELLPERITVLFLASNPRDQQQLSLDEEVRLISDMVRKSAHRDAVRLESRWALRTFDLFQALNETKPRIVHFSGHGSDQDEIVFQDDSGKSKFVSKDAIVQTMAATAEAIQLVFFNTCYSRSQAEAVVKHVPAAIGMNTTIGDVAARTFAAQFYSAIGFGLSLQKAFNQARAQLMLDGIPEDSTPELFNAASIDPADLILVRPPA